MKRTRKHGAFAVAETFDIEIKPVEDRRDSLTVAQALKAVYRQMEISGNRPRTIESYAFAWNEFIKVTGVKYVEDIDADMIYDYLNEIDVSKATKLVRLKSLKAILNRFFDNRWIEIRFWSKIQIKVDKSIKGAAKENDVEVLLSLIDRSTFVGFRDTCAILLMYRTGIRITTLGELRERHIDLDSKTIDMDGAVLKNRDTLKLPIDDQLADMLRVLIEKNKQVRRKYNTRNSYVFLSANGQGINNSQSSSNAISKSLTKYAREFGLKNVNAHALRRAFATNLLNQGANVALISKALGHKSLETTTVYLDLEKEFVAESLREYL
ncbi:tyrosine-type recombinase/integrase [Solibacillus sp. FSL K6-1126]|uniref:tyrosine-type recombinase/integrase n=1 Tax=Solibacillus sp. FSL K6-1126 TaxID=2921463 RepID=UPI0030FBB100